MKNQFATAIGKLVRLSVRFRPHGGHALPGLVVDNLFPNYVYSMLGKLPGGVVFITGTNGKTTTTKILTELLQANRKRILTNSTGSNMVRGITSSLIKNSSLSAKLPYDLAVFEVDEASISRLVAKIKPRWVLALNVSRDQLDRFGEVDAIAAHVAAAMDAATEGVITNADDPNLLKIGQSLNKSNRIDVCYFAAAPKLKKFFPSDYDIAAVGPKKPETKLRQPSIYSELVSFEGQQVDFKLDGESIGAKLKLTGQHNFLNAAAALGIAKKLLPSVGSAELANHLSQVSIAFGRGESYRLKNGTEVELVLVKNPASFRQALASYAATSDNLMIAINDNIADSRDVSWLWDVDFSPLKGRGVALTSGSRGADMALRLSYDGITVKAIETDLSLALSKLSKQTGPKVILATYTAMLNLYGTLTKIAEKIS
jgi:lipid II isoglutaminyl synthase (glutamine-hydrolysing)